MPFEKVDTTQVWQGQIATVRVDRFVHDDGQEVRREYVAHPGAVAIVATDGSQIFMVSQPREAVGEQSVLELPAGKLDDLSEDVLATAKRELAEEIGKGARSWKKLTNFYASPGFTDENICVYLATDLYDENAEAEENERIEVIAFSLARLDELIAQCRDAKSLVGLLWFRSYEA
jgi:8-oxo-dGTP pyrophosphatase MutT (NUDIX family)